MCVCVNVFNANCGVNYVKTEVLLVPLYCLSCHCQPVGKWKMVPAEEKFGQLTSGPLFPGSGSGEGGQYFGPVLPV